MKNILFIISVIVLGVSVYITLSSPERKWRNPFIQTGNHETLLFPDDVPPAKADRLLFEGAYLNFVQIINESRRAANQEALKESNLETISKNVKRESMHINRSIANSNNVSLVTFYSFDLMANNSKIPGRVFFAIQWEFKDKQWVATDVVSTTPLMR